MVQDPLEIRRISNRRSEDQEILIKRLLNSCQTVLILTRADPTRYSNPACGSQME